MSGNDLQASITTSLRGNGLTAATSGTDKLTAATKKANKEARDFQLSAGAAFSDTAKGATNAHGPISQLGRALRMMGGESGQLAGHLGHASGLSGGLMAVGIAAVGAGIAFKVFDAIVKRNIETARMAIDAHKQMRDAMKGGQDVINSQAKSGDAQVGEIRSLRAAGGEQAYRAAVDIAEHSGLGISTSEANRGVTAIYGRNGQGFRSQKAMDSALSLARAGVPFEKAAEAAARAGTLLDTQQGRDLFESSFYSKHTGYAGIDPVGNFHQAQANTNTTFLNQGGKDIDTRNEIARLERNATIANGGAAAVAERDVAADPLQKAYNDLRSAHDEKMRDMDRMIKSDNRFMAALQDFAGAFGGMGSLRTQKGRMQDSFNSSNGK